MPDFGMKMQQSVVIESKKMSVEVSNQENIWPEKTITLRQIVGT